MKRKVSWIIILILLFSLFLQGNSAPLNTFELSRKTIPAASPTATPKKDQNKVTNRKTIRGRLIKKPPYCITVNGYEDEDFLVPLWDIQNKTKLNIVGKRDEESVTGKWMFFVTFTMAISGDTELPEEVSGSLNMGMIGELYGYAEANLTSAGKSSRDKYKTEFEVPLSGSFKNTDRNSIYGEVGKGDQRFTVGVDIISDGMSFNSTGKVTMTVDAFNNVIATVKIDGKTYGPFAGIFTSEEELTTKRKENSKWPIWGVWTDVNPYEPMPNIEKDLSNQVGLVDTSRKEVNYPEGRWLMLNKGGKGNPRTYTIIQVSAEDITYERGDLSSYPGGSLYEPEFRNVYSKDLSIISEGKPQAYTAMLTYHEASDTIWQPRFGRLVRVRNVNILGVWSMIKDELMPDVSQTDDLPEGIWYEFKKADKKEQDEAQPIYSSGYSFTRITVTRDRGVERESGRAIMAPIADNEYIILTDIKSVLIAPDRTKTETTKEDEIITITDYSKGQLSINLQNFYQVQGLNLKGRWSSIEPSVEPPDIERGTFKIEAENGNITDPPHGAQWLEFNSSDKTFVWTRVLADPEGILVQKGNYYTYGKDLLLLYDIKGSFYAVPGTGFEGFTDKEYMYGEKLFQIEHKINKIGKPESLAISEVGSFVPIED